MLTNAAACTLDMAVLVDDADELESVRHTMM
jgi:hypothetical protein